MEALTSLATGIARAAKSVYDQVVLGVTLPDTDDSAPQEDPMNAEMGNTASEPVVGEPPLDVNKIFGLGHGQVLPQGGTWVPLYVGEDEPNASLDGWS